MNRFICCMGMGVLITVGAGIGQARAVDITRYAISHGPASCQTALPVFDGNIRKRPMGISNEGGGSAFITCDSESTEYGSSNTVQEVGIYFTNKSTGAVTLSCTLVDGLLPYKPSTAFPKTSSSVAANASGVLSWTPADNGSNNFNLPAVSCNLAPGMEVNAVQYIRSEDVGS